MLAPSATTLLARQSGRGWVGEWVREYDSGGYGPVALRLTSVADLSTLEKDLEAFAANAFFTAGMVVFEVPTGIVADMWGRRASFLLGTVTLTLTTLIYVLLWRVEAAFWLWAAVSMLLGLGFTFFSGATEAWLVDALAATGFDGTMESVFGRGQIVTGVGMLGGSVAGGYLAQVTDLGVPFLVRAGILVAVFALAFAVMHDEGFTPSRGRGPRGLVEPAVHSMPFRQRGRAKRWPRGFLRRRRVAKPGQKRYRKRHRPRPAPPGRPLARSAVADFAGTGSQRPADWPKAANSMAFQRGTSISQQTLTWGSRAATSPGHPAP